MPTAKPSSVLSAAAAKKLWNLYGFESSKDLVLEDLAMALGVVVLEGHLKAADAWLIRKGEKGIIRVSDAIPELGRRRFAVAHELGHWSLHKTLSQLLSCTSADMLARYKASAPEIEANMFAAELLMPTHLFQPALGASQPTARFVNELAERFGTTRTSTAFRIADLTKDYFALVMSKDGKVAWWQASDALAEYVWIENGGSVPRYSVAAKFFAGESLPDAPQKIDVGDWFSENRGLDAECFYEDVIPMPRYGKALSLLWLE
ncbi:ImmA/IrrE family metallo-endopeptidase [Aeoliella sp. ICT_H6.2]|uniref:ImmA/IrrE family metallo-endopeptidase n=1 Tax=Aeoliella straminimaris TaxID=2954799 RepID=A0A9X2JEY9_9BACT|nr:ImmA/IrrE family metallo-endopeptidase [Aeoliella straminimaris]MCO6042702.1 ImmA/IrrE family metallo-endopeptidase [Aeoliella straminimaris]